MTSNPHHPQRLSPAASPGSLLKRMQAFNVRRRLERTKELMGHEPAYLADIRQLPCLKCGLEPCCEAAHIRRQSAAHGKFGGMGKKPLDRHALCLCPDCHWRDKDALHRIGESEFFARIGIDPLLACERLYAARGDLIAMRAVALAIIGERG